MDLWIIVTIGAAFSQNLRFMLQKHLKATALSTGGATFARFVYSFPAVALIALIYARTTVQPLPPVAPGFWPYAMVGAVAQITATMCTVALFSHRNFAVGIALKKTEVLMAAALGFIVLSDRVSALGLFAILVGLVGVVLLGKAPGREARWLSRATALGLASGALFAVSGVGYRGAALALDTDDAFFAAILSLSFVTAFQTLILGLWLRAREAGEVSRVLAAWRVAALVGLTSMIGSIGWFWAFALQTVAYVKALGQIEILFSITASVLVFKETISARESAGILFLALSILLIVLAL